ncbi:hypothetical protein [Ascidiaceihabitans sp.]|uniref:hypothetical protein n=1 Tax=Ascidiaceihabitans sp. TaxID=1872644 RepID=UPI003296BD56
MTIKSTILAWTVLVTGTTALAESEVEQRASIMAELSSLSEQCSKLESGEAQTEIFGIEIIRVGDTCAVVHGEEFDARMQTFLEEENLPWAGIALWVKADRTTD